MNLKKRLQQESEQIVPDVRARVLHEYYQRHPEIRAAQVQQEAAARTSAVARVECVESARQEPSRRTQRTKSVRARRNWLRVAVAAVAACLCVAVIVPFMMRSGGVSSADHVYLKINPAFEMTVKDGKLDAVIALNGDAQLVLTGETLTGLPIADACMRLTELSDKLGFLTEKGVRVVVSGKDESTLYGAITSKLKSKFTVDETVSNDVVALAKEYGVSVGKMEIALAVCEKNPKLKLKKAVKMDLDDLVEELEDYDAASLEALAKKLEEMMNAELSSEQTALRARYKEALEVLEGLEDTLDEQEKLYEDALELGDADATNAILSSLMAEFEAFNAQYGELGAVVKIPHTAEKKFFEKLEDALDEATEKLDSIAEGREEEWEEWEDALDDLRDDIKKQWKDHGFDDDDD